MSCPAFGKGALHWGIQWNSLICEALFRVGEIFNNKVWKQILQEPFVRQRWRQQMRTDRAKLYIRSVILEKSIELGIPVLAKDLIAFWMICLMIKDLCILVILCVCVGLVRISLVTLGFGQTHLMQGRRSHKIAWQKESVYVVICLQLALLASLILLHNTRQIHDLMQPQTLIGRGATSMILLPEGICAGRGRKNEQDVYRKPKFSSGVDLWYVFCRQHRLTWI